MKLCLSLTAYGNCAINLIEIVITISIKVSYDSRLTCLEIW